MPTPCCKPSLPRNTNNSALALGLVLVLATSPALAELVGRASVIDGDTIEIAGQRIRFHGIDAPEASQACLDGEGRQYRCGRVAAHALDVFLSASRPTHCQPVGRNRERVVARCYRHDGESVARWLVSEGLALDWPKYSKGEFASDEERAREAGRGMWQGQFVEPWRYRKLR